MAIVTTIGDKQFVLETTHDMQTLEDILMRAQPIQTASVNGKTYLIKKEVAFSSEISPGQLMTEDEFEKQIVGGLHANSN